MAENNESKQNKNKPKKLEITVLTLSGEYTHKYEPETVLSKIVADTIKHLKLVANDSWILEFNGAVVAQTQTLLTAGLQDGSELDFHAPEGGGGSSR